MTHITANKVVELPYSVLDCYILHESIPLALNIIRLKYSNRQKLNFSLDLPVSGTSVGLMILRICSIDCRSGDSPGDEKYSSV